MTIDFLMVFFIIITRVARARFLVYTSFFL
nr:MAG TPA: hypothetical protein [Caudoviricetes sp.]